MELEKVPSSSVRNPYAPAGLLGILSVVFGFWFLSKVSAPKNDSRKTVHPRDTPAAETRGGQTTPGRVLFIETPADSDNARHGANKKAPWWEKAAISVALGLLIVNSFQMRATQNAAEAARSAAVTADRSMKLAYRPRLLLIGIDARVRSSPTGIGPALDNRRLTIQIVLPNTGPFAARNVRVFRYSSVSPRADVQKGIYEELLGEPKVIPSKAENYNYGMVIVGTKTVTDYQIQELQSGTLWATFSVLVQYDDDFGITHHTEYCGLFTLKGDREICPWPVQND